MNLRLVFACSALCLLGCSAPALHAGTGGEERKPASLSRPSTFDFEKLDRYALDSMITPAEKELASGEVLSSIKAFVAALAPVLQPINTVQSAIDDANLPYGARSLMSFRLRIFHRGADPHAFTSDEMKTILTSIEKEIPTAFDFSADSVRKISAFVGDRYSKHRGFDSVALHVSSEISMVDDEKLNQVFHAAAKAMRELILVQDGHYRKSFLEIVNVQNTIDWWRFVYGEVPVDEIAKRLKLRPEAARAFGSMYQKNQELLMTFCKSAKLDCN